MDHKQIAASAAALGLLLLGVAASATAGHSARHRLLQPRHRLGAGAA
jgi:hypothetical protein